MWKKLFSKNKKAPPVLPPEETQMQEDDLPTGAETGEDLSYNEAAGSFERDTELPDAPESEYQHPDPYDTAVPQATDHMSTFDEANQYTPNEYRDDTEAAADQVETMDEGAARDRLMDLNEVDEALASTPEDERSDLDAEGYPLKDPPDERDPLGDKQIQSDDPTERDG